MNYALIAYKNTKNTRQRNKAPPSILFYKFTEPGFWQNIVGLYNTLDEATTEFERETTKNRKWIQLVVLASREIIRSQEVYEIGYELDYGL
jgi:hypothetical protein